MPRFTVTESLVIPSVPMHAYAVIADYEDGHPRILPPKYFAGLQVERGGVGDGTAIRFGMRAFGRTRWSRATVAEPEPGRVLVETIAAEGIVTTFTVDPVPAGCAVTISTEMSTRGGGISGAVEKWLARAFLRRVYVDELALLRSVVVG